MANGDRRTVQDIIDTSVAARKALAAKSRTLGAQLFALERKSPKTDADRASMQEIQAALGDVNRADEALALLTAQSIEDSDALSRIVATLGGITAELKRKKTSLDHLGEIAATVAEVVGVVETVALEAAKHLAS